MKQKQVLFQIAWISLGITGVAILVFGLITTVWPGSSDPATLRAIGVASMGMGLFGVMITVIAYRRRERWAWFTLWYYPIFWIAHLLGGLPPGQEHVHQVVFIILPLFGLLIPVGEFFPHGLVGVFDALGSLAIGADSPLRVWRWKDRPWNDKMTNPSYAHSARLNTTSSRSDELRESGG